jgi:hypothetical protein
MPNSVPVRHFGETEMIPVWELACLSSVPVSSPVSLFVSGVETGASGIFRQTGLDDRFFFLPRTVIF